MTNTYYIIVYIQKKERRKDKLQTIKATLIMHKVDLA